jgi:putative FmdB family regulatory protein
VPKYEFLCEDCGPFEERRPFAEVGDPMMCPSCGEEARRVYSMPNLKTVSTALSNAMNRVEKSAHEPKVARQAEGGTWPGKRYHPGHGGHHGHNH